MELRQLQHFVAVAEEGHFTRAARRVNIVQSALSTSIRLLESELSAKLFVRSTRQVRLTAAGRAFLDKAKLALETVRDARNAVAAVQGMKSGTLNLGTVQSLPAFLDLPSLVSEFHFQHPGVEVRLCQGSSTSLLEKVRNGRLDLAFLPLCEPPTDVATALIACEPLVLVSAPGAGFAKGGDVAFSALSGLPFVDFEPDWGTRRLVDRGFFDAGVDRRIAFEVNDLGTLLDLVARGLGVALVPEAIAKCRSASLAISRLLGPELCWELVVAFNPGDGANSTPVDAAASAFLNLLHKARRVGDLGHDGEHDLSLNHV